MLPAEAGKRILELGDEAVQPLIEIIEDRKGLTVNKLCPALIFRAPDLALVSRRSTAGNALALLRIDDEDTRAKDQPQKREWGISYLRSDP